MFKKTEKKKLGYKAKAKYPTANFLCDLFLYPSKKNPFASSIYLADPRTKANE